LTHSTPSEPGVLKSVFSFPLTVNEVSARLVAAMVVALSLAIVVTGVWWLMPILAYGFLARVLTGPTLSPIGLLATRVLTPRLGLPERIVAGRPKQFAQAIGLIFSTAALILYLVTDSMTASRVVIGILTVFAAMESGLGFCFGCYVFNRLMVWGLIPESVCRECMISPELLAEME